MSTGIQNFFIGFRGNVYDYRYTLYGLMNWLDLRLKSLKTKTGKHTSGKGIMKSEPYDFHKTNRAMTSTTALITAQDNLCSSISFTVYSSTKVTMLMPVIIFTLSC